MMNQQIVFMIKVQNYTNEYIRHKKFIAHTIASLLDGVFAFIIYDKETNDLFVGRDPIGIRPLFYGTRSDGFSFSSEAKSLESTCSAINPFLPGHIAHINHDNNIRSFDILPYYEFKYNLPYFQESEHDITYQIRNLLVDSVKKRLMSERPLGIFLSGGLDSSIIGAITAQCRSNIDSFAVGFNDSPDIEAAKKVAKALKTNHHSVEFSLDDGINVLHDVIKQLETYDITTIRASTPQYLLSKYINEKTDIRVLLSGEGADELFGGYLYFHYAPNEIEFQDETIRLMKQLYQYDVLRTDRTTAGNGLEVRVPFLDKKFIDFVLNLHPKYKKPNMDEGKIEKYILRKAFENMLPKDIVWRKKDAFSDACGYGWVPHIKKYAESQITDLQLENAKELFAFNTPTTKEGYLYRQIFESYYPNKSHWIPDIWRPNQDWVEEKEPSATSLSIFNQ